MGTRTFRRAREVLNELKWREGRDMSQAEIWFADRNEPLGYKVIRGGDIMEVGRGYFSTAEAMLPYYKILRIEYDGKALFDQREANLKTTGRSAPGLTREKRHG